jgi:hypothetical protein
MTVAGVCALLYFLVGLILNVSFKTGITVHILNNDHTTTYYFEIFA